MALFDVLRRPASRSTLWRWDDLCVQMSYSKSESSKQDRRDWVTTIIAACINWKQCSKHDLPYMPFKNFKKGVVLLQADGSSFKVVRWGIIRIMGYVGIIVSQKFWDAIASKERSYDCLIKIIVTVEQRMCNFFLAFRLLRASQGRFPTPHDEKAMYVLPNGSAVVLGDINILDGTAKTAHSRNCCFGYGTLM